MSTLQTTNIKNPSSASNNIVLDASGQVGFGTASPGATVHVAGKIRFGTNATYLGEISHDAAVTGANIYDSQDSGGHIFRANGSDRALIDGSGNFKFNSGYGSVATAYGCRAWVNFNGTGTVAIRGSGNVSSITDNGVGDYTVNFTTAMADANYSVTGTAGQATSAVGVLGVFSNSGAANPSTTAVRIFTRDLANNPADHTFDNVAIFR